MTVRIELGEENRRVTPVHENDYEFVKNLLRENEPVTDEYTRSVYPEYFQLPLASGIVRSRSGITWREGLELPAVDLRVSLTPGGAEEYGSSYYAHPVSGISVQVPDGDLEAVQVWLGRISGGLTGVSETLEHRMTNAVMGAIRSYFRAMSQAGQFTRPFRLGVALRLLNGHHLLLGEPQLVVPNSKAPLMLIHEPGLHGNTLSTLTEIINTPTEVTVDVGSFVVSPALAGQVTHLDFITTEETSVLDGDEAVTAIRSYSYAGENYPGWYYQSPGADVVRQRALADGCFRVIGSVPIEEAVMGISGMRIPAAGFDLGDWSSCMPYVEEEEENPGIDPENPPAGYNYVLLETIPLSLGNPEMMKRVRRLTVRGIFERRGFHNIAGRRELQVTLYGSQHRDFWHRIATSRGPHIGLLRGVQYRWLRVSILAPRDAQLDALSFVFEG